MNISNLSLTILWVAGVVLADGWLKLVAFFLPFYSWYLVAEKILTHFGIV